MKINKNHIIITLLIGIIILLAKCNSDVNSNFKKQEIITKNNISVLKDSVKKYKTSNGNFISERGILIADKKELKDLNRDLYDNINRLEKELNAKPKVVISYKTKIIHDTVYLNNEREFINDSTVLVSFYKDTSYNKNNSRNLEGEILIELIKDSTDFNDIVINHVKITKDDIKIDGNLILGMKDGELKVWFESSYPGLDVDEIEAVTLDPDIHDELKKLNNKRWSVGPYVGIGVGENLKISPSIGIGIQFKLFKF